MSDYGVLWSRNDQKTGFHAFCNNACPHHLGPAFRFHVDEVNHLPGTQRSAIVRHAETAGADVNQFAVDFKRFRIGEFNAHFARGKAPGFASFLLCAQTVASLYPAS